MRRAARAARRSTSSRRASWRGSKRSPRGWAVVARVAVRMNPDIDARSHPHISTGLRDQQVRRAGRRRRGSWRRRSRTGPSLTLVAIHVHVGSQITTLEPLRRAAAFARAARRDELARLGHSRSSIVDVGGGLGDLLRRRPVGRRRATTSRRSWRKSARRGLPIVVEPGRSIVGPAGVLVARVVDVKPRDAASDVRRHRRRHDRAAAAGALQRLSSHRAGQAARAAANTGTRSSDRSARAATSSVATARCPPLEVGRSGRDSRCRRVRLGDGVELQPPPAARRSARRRGAAGGSSAAARPSTTCLRWRIRLMAGSADRLRRSRSERQADAGGAAARSSSPRRPQGAPGVVSRLRHVDRRGDRAGAARASASTAPT